MSEYDDDNIEFDFFEEPTPEPEPRRGLPRRPRRPDGPSRPPSRPTGPGLVPLLRLLGLIAAAIAVVLLVVEIGGCSSSSDAYKSYLDKVTTIAKASQDQGGDLTGILAKSSLTEATLEQTLGGLVTTADAQIQAAKRISPPGPLRAQHEDLIDALTLRRNALTGLLATFKRTAHEKKDTGIGAVLAEQTQRLAASDVVWHDFFVTATAATLAQHGVHGAPPPGSVFLKTPGSLDATSLGNLWTRVHGSAVSSGTVRGTALESVKASSKRNADGSPQVIVLDPTGTTTIQASSELKFYVAVKDTGEVQEPNVKVTLTIVQNPPLPALKPVTRVIPVINPGETQTVTIPFSQELPNLNQPLKVNVRVTPVPNEARFDNNSHQYTVVFQV